MAHMGLDALDPVTTTVQEILTPATISVENVTWDVIQGSMACPVKTFVMMARMGLNAPNPVTTIVQEIRTPATISVENVTWDVIQDSMACPVKTVLSLIF
ncbi:hypothetical protein PoB_007484600 [Plakobranchus ocellatus]|uniref:Uncharacterized protein n=1 Tax=Plakobranchus ocellatus TaxID=259542 RepID=A0AAV4DWR1_9GAST|nr:hypothetical protein PoB_007484600 [Plakobranchus ocellatus]